MAYCGECGLTDCYERGGGCARRGVGLAKNWINDVIEETSKEVGEWPAEMRRDEVRVSSSGPRNGIPCPSCTDPGFAPSHNGSPRCESGSIASGGRNAHCACDVCF